jgi:hypothetical protein
MPIIKHACMLACRFFSSFEELAVKGVQKGQKEN